MAFHRFILAMCLSGLSLWVWAQDAGNVQLVGVGGTFPKPIYDKWFEEFGKTHTAFHFSYIPSGSEQGIEMVNSGQSDFGASDAPLTDRQLAQAKVHLLHFPTVIGAVVVIYNLPNVTQTLRFTSKALAGIYLGTIRVWNHPEIASANPGVALPPSEIVVVHTADGRGDTYIWSDYLSKVSDEWRTRVGRGTTVTWPVGKVGEGNGNVAKLVKLNPNSIGFVQLGFAVESHLSYGEVRNAAGTFVSADLASVGAAAEASASTMRSDLRSSITNPPGNSSYPIASYTWMLIPERIGNDNKRKAVKEFLRWMLKEGQIYAGPLNYAALPQELADKELRVIDQVH
jgi:phosphate transport system substrate-binding protein